MNGNADDNLNQLFAAARKTQPDTTVMEQHFETRLMARIRERQENRRSWFFWLWRLIPVFTVLLLMLSIASLTTDLTGSQDLFAAITNGRDDFTATSYLGGE